MRAYTGPQIAANSSGDKVRATQVSDNTNTWDIQHVTTSEWAVILDAATVTASGSQVLFIGGASEIDVIVNIKSAPTGTSPTLQFTIQDVDPGDQSTTLNTGMSSQSFNAVSTGVMSYSTDCSFVKVSWTLGGSASPTFTNTYLSICPKPQSDARGASRTYITFYYDRATGVTTEALASMTINKNGTTSTATSYTVTAGKTLRVQTLHTEILNTGATANRTIARFRCATSGGTLSSTSPIVVQSAAQAPLATTSSGESDDTPIPDGVDIVGGNIVGISHLENTTSAGIASALVIAYEY